MIIQIDPDPRGRSRSRHSEAGWVPWWYTVYRRRRPGTLRKKSARPPPRPVRPVRPSDSPSSPMAGGPGRPPPLRWDCCFPSGGAGVPARLSDPVTRPRPNARIRSRAADVAERAGIFDNERGKDPPGRIGSVRLRPDPQSSPARVSMIEPRTNPGSEEHESIERYDLEVVPL